MKRILSLLLLVLLNACASDSTVLPPAELIEYPARADISSEWKNNVGPAQPNGAQLFRPFLTDSAIYTVNRQQEMVATSVTDGHELWRKAFDVEFLAGVSGNEKSLFATAFDGSLLSINQEDGELQWRQEMAAEALVPPAATSDLLILHNNDGTILGLSVSDGEERWRYSYKKPVLTLHGYGKPLIVPGGVLLGLDDGSLVALTLEGGKEIWKTQLSRAEGRSEVERLVDLDGNLVIDQQFIYAVNYQGKVAQIEPGKGNIVWSRPMTSTSGVSVDNKLLYVTEPDGYVWALDKRTGASLWKMEKLEGRRLTRPVPYRDYVVVGDLEGYVHLLSKADGSQVARFDIDSSPIVSEPIIHDGKLLIQSRGGVIHQLSVESKLAHKAQ